MQVFRKKNKENDFFELLPQAITRLKKNIIDPFFGDDGDGRYEDERPPLRSEIFTKDKMDQHAVSLAKRHVLVYEKTSEQLLKRLAENEHILLEVHALLTNTIKENKRVAPAAEWLLDNFYLIEEQIYTGKRHLPKGYSKTLPRLLKGESAGLPRVYDMAVEIISHSDGHVNINSLVGFINAYQTISKLKLGELWAIPIMLRLALLENLRRLSILIAEEITNKSLANKWADEMIAIVEKDPKNLVLVIADMARSDPPMESTFVAELTRRLQEKGSSLSLPLNWIEQRLSEMGLSSSELIQQDNQAQAATQVSISNSINSLRFLSTTNWRDFVEETSIVEATLKRDIDNVYAKMDFNTRDDYRHAVEKIARYSELSEQEVAEMVIDNAQKNHLEKNNPKLSHVGYYLTGKGYVATAKAAEAKTKASEKFRRFANKHPSLIYLGSITVLSFLVSWGLLAEASREIHSIWLLAVACIVVLLATTHLAVAIVNWLSTILIGPGLLPRMDFSKGIPDEARSMVVIPTIITSVSSIDSIVEGLEVRFLANRDINLYFALLTDFKDAPTEHLQEDESLLQLLKKKIIDLNNKYSSAAKGNFFLFHRPRKWNKNDKVWMGYERKRGKLAELNALLRGSGEDCFTEIIGDKSILGSFKYIITLDTDTQLPRDTAWKMIGTMAHPLNVPFYNKKKKRVTEGYSILQPRVSNSLPPADSSLYARLHSNDAHTDPYTKAVSDVYQDLFREGSFIGKGIYSIDAFEAALKDRFPENRILSHDLLEGCYARSAMITDVQLYEEYPMRYDIDMQRRHRWTRGDWQIGKWILPLVPEHDKRLHKNPLSLFSRWKIFDNIRRSLVSLSLLLLFLFGWTISTAPWFWTAAVSLIIVLPAFVSFFWELSRRPSDVIFIQQLIYTARSAFNNLLQQLLDLTFLPYEAYRNVNAILLTLWRMFISHRKLLEWNPYSSTQTRQNNILRSYKTMWFEPVFAIAVYTYLTIYDPFALLFALPFLSFWMMGPLIAYAISRPAVTVRNIISAEKNTDLRMLSRKIWSFFEKFITAEDNWLPPDNYQEEPVDRLAHRTSPTNIGLSLLSNLTAYDFGYITNLQLLERTGNTIATMQRMERFRGHLYNWYDTVSLAPLHPKYISTVDSGNMAAHLITLKQGLLELPDKKIFQPNFFEGLVDTVNIVIEKSKDKEKELFIKFRNEIKKNYKHKTDTLDEIKNYIKELERSLATILIEADFVPDQEPDIWAQKVLQQITVQQKNITSLAPWLLFTEVPEKFQALIPALPSVPTLKQIALIEQALLEKITKFFTSDNNNEENEWLTNFRSAITEAARRAKELILTVEQLAEKCISLSNMDYDFLFDRSQNLLSIGYNAEEHRRDNSYYDLLASEARLATYIAIAQSKLPQESWFALGRQLTNIGTTPVLLSWSGSMFEYLMPLLVMPTFENTLLDQTNKSVIQKQIEYGKRRGIPWGISESGYNMVDADLNYQYKAFGVPGIGFKRGLGEDLVISPYATVMALMVDPGEAYNNIQVLKQEGFEGNYGFYEAVDYTASRLPRKQKRVIIRSFMAHHQGMSFLSLAYLLLNRPMQQRFESEVHLKSALLLLQEKIPRVATFYSPSVHAGDLSIAPAGDSSIRVVNTPNTVVPEVQLLSNGRYHVMVTNAGGGYSRWKNMAVTRWREDSTCDNWGNFCYIRDLESNLFWSSAYQPTLQQGENYEAVFSQGRAEFRRRDFSLETHTEIVVSPEDDIELKRVHITNRSRKKRMIEITSYAEVVLAVAAADEAHPAFSNLFVQTEINEQRHAILCTRRPRSVDEKNPWMLHLMKVHDAEVINISYETDRDKFIGRGNNINQPQAIKQTGTLENNSGSVLDPIVSIQYRIIIEANATATIDILSGMAETRELCNDLIAKYQERHLFNRVLELAWTHSQVILRQINAVEADAQLYSRLAGSIIFSNPLLRADPAVIMKNNRGQSGLWSYSISGDIPIVLVQIEDSSNVALVKQMVQAHLYWRLKGLIVDLLIWNDDHGGYRQELHNQIQGLIAPGMDLKDQPGGIFIRSSEQVSNEDRILFQTVAHVIIADRYGTLEEQMNRRTKIKTTIPYFSPVKFYPSVNSAVESPAGLLFFNGLGGFTSDGKEYIITTNPDKKTPAPWVNVIANPEFGTVVSESGQSYTWVDNAHEIRLTPWNNDPVSDLKGETFYLKDEESGRFWSPTPLPCYSNSPYITRHGFGYSVFEHSEDGIHSEMTIFVDIEMPVKYIVIKLHNQSGRLRKLSATGYVEWVLGDLRAKYLKHTITELDENSGAILARNAYSSEFTNRIAFFDASGKNKTITGDRTEFLGRNGTMNNPDGLNRTRFSGKTGAALDPCAAIQIAFDLAEDEEHEIIFRLGAGRNMQHALDTIHAAEGPEVAQQALSKVHSYWNKALGMVNIKTPDIALNILTNGWLNYQTLASRIWARSGFYQSGGAFGFRDQLQDVLSLIYTQPQLVRSQILLCASRQFKEGDVQHWWHPPTGRGVRTTCSDDYLWLPFVTCNYVFITGDTTILDEQAHFLEGRLLNAGEESYYDLPIRSDATAGLYEHCVKSIEHGLRFGEHGLPFIGSGDWNDGMDKVGAHGKGESVWLAFFLYDILIRFQQVALLKHDIVFAERCKSEAEKLKKNTRDHAWDGKWYRRAYFDDGTPLGSNENIECKIDSIAQSWSVLSNAGDDDRKLLAMQSADKHLVRKEDGMIQLFNPPFDKSNLNPGYIKGYVPGVRENGGQYTHAAIWLVMAFAAIGDRKRTWELLQMINPLNRGNDEAKIQVYKTEPYVIAADIYAEPKHKGRGGWTWYTGSAGWMYQLIINSFIGLKKEGDSIRFNPCIPLEWKNFDISYIFGETKYHISFSQSGSAKERTMKVFVNDSEQSNGMIPLINDGKTHEVRIEIASMEMADLSI